MSRALFFCSLTYYAKTVNKLQILLNYSPSSLTIAAQEQSLIYWQSAYKQKKSYHVGKTFKISIKNRMRRNEAKRMHQLESIEQQRSAPSVNQYRGAEYITALPSSAYRDEQTMAKITSRRTVEDACPYETVQKTWKKLN